MNLDRTHESERPPRQEAPEKDLSRPFGLPAIGDVEIDLRQVLLTLWRRKWVIFGSVMLITTFATLTVFQMTPKYTASAKVMLDTRRNQVIDIESVLSGLSSDAATVLSEMEILNSRSLMERLVRQLGLIDDPEFNGALRPPGFLSATLHPRNWLPAAWAAVVFPNAGQELSPSEKQARTRAQVVDAVIERFSISPVRRSYVITLAFTSEDPRMAALATNSLADLYIVDQLEAKFEATRRATSWLSERLGDLRAKVGDSERAAETYRARQGLTRGKGVSLNVQQLSEINTQLILSRSAKAEAEARLQQVETLLKSAGGAESAIEVLSSPLITQLRGQETEVLRKASEMASRYGERHPKMINIRAEVRDLKKKIEFEVSKIAKGLANEVAIARAREASLQASLKKLEQKAAGQGRSQVRLRALEREATANRLLYESFLARFKETGQQEDLQRADARIISRAEPPAEPSFPNKRLIVVLAFAGSVFVGFAVVFLLERLDNGFRTGEQIESLTGIPTLGMVPTVSGIKAKKQLDRYVLFKPTSSVSESIRGIRTSLMLPHPRPQIIAVTSTVPAEGKTMLALNLARVAAKSGQKVILIDCDFRRPRVHTSLGIANDLTLLDVIADNKKFLDVARLEMETGLMVVPSKSIPGNPLDLLDSPGMRTLIEASRDKFDVVILDCPPVLAVSDIKIIGQYTDKLIYTVKWDSTPREAVLAGLKQVTEAGISLGGIVLTYVNVRKHARYGYGDSGYYYARYKEYYAD